MTTQMGPIPRVAEIFLKQPFFSYAYLYWATANHCQSGNVPNSIKHWKGSKNSLFLATSENLNRSGLRPIT